MDYYRQIAVKWQRFDDRAKYEVDRDLGSGTTFKLIGRNGLIFARGPFVWEFNVDAKMYGGSFIPGNESMVFYVRHKTDRAVHNSQGLRFGG